jgi:hypothetical protein
VQVGRWFVAGSLVCAAACSVFTAAEEPSLPAGPVDASSNDGLASEAASDAPVAVSDAAADVADASAWTPCSAAAFACDDFDTSNMVRPFWTLNGVDAEIPKIVALPSAPSAPNVLEVDVTSNARAWLTHGSAKQIRELACAFEMMIVTQGDAPAILGEITLRGAGASYTRVSLMSNAVSEAVAGDGGVPSGQSAPVALPVGTWMHVTMALRVGAAGAARVTIDGLAFNFQQSTNYTTALPTFVFGASVSPGGNPAWKIDFDNVICDVVP